MNFEIRVGTPSQKAPKEPEKERVVLTCDKLVKESRKWSQGVRKRWQERGKKRVHSFTGVKFRLTSI